MNRRERKSEIFLHNSYLGTQNFYVPENSRMKYSCPPGIVNTILPFRNSNIIIYLVY